VLIQFAWIPFRSPYINQTIEIWKGMIGVHGISHPFAALTDISFIFIVLSGTLIFPNCHQRWPGKSGMPESVMLWLIATFAIFNSPQILQFIYFQF